MINFKKDVSLCGTDIPFCVVTAEYPCDAPLCTDAFYALAENEINRLKAEYCNYDRKAVWGENPYFRFFRKFKKTYPVMLQFESAVLKDRPFPHFNPVSEVAFLAEITTGVLSGCHDTNSISGDVTLYLADSREDFEGMHGTLHTYPDDFCARDGEGIIFSLIAGTDRRTSAAENSRYVFYPLFGTPCLGEETLRNAADRLVGYIKVLCPSAETETRFF